jgi:chorismate synthase
MISSFETPRGLIQIRELNGIAEMEAAEQIQLEVWGTDAIPHPKEILIPIQHEGGLLAGAFYNDLMVGLVFSFPTRDPSIQHSQLLATVDDWRGLNIGTRLKWYQRDWCQERGVYSVRWTVDPLRTANAELNIRHLGGICATYYLDYYGPMKGIDAGAPTDRFLIEWHLSNQRVNARFSATPKDNGFPEAVSANQVADGVPGLTRLNLKDPQILIHLPGNFIETSRAQPDLALQWRMHTRELFMHYFAQGYCITEYTRIGGPAYLLEKGLLYGN